jgi:hypothetical protein
MNSASNTNTNTTSAVNPHDQELTTLRIDCAPPAVNPHEQPYLSEEELTQLREMLTAYSERQITVEQLAASRLLLGGGDRR